MAQPWIAEFDLSPDLAKNLIETQFPQLKPATLEVLGEGWDNAAYLVNEKWVFRFPKREVAAPSILNECRILPVIATQLPLPVPHPIFQGKPTNTYPWHFAGYEKLKGDLACGARLTDQERRACAVPLAQFLAKLHASTSLFPQGVLPQDPFGRNDVEKTRTRLETYVEKAKPYISQAHYRDVQTMLAQPLKMHLKTDALVHGDLYVRHLLLDSQRSLSGIIDWGDATLADPAVDLCICLTFLPPDAHESFREAYGPIRKDSWHYAQIFAVFYGLVLMHFGHEIHDQDLIFEATRILDYWQQAKSS